MPDKGSFPSLIRLDPAFIVKSVSAHVVVGLVSSSDDVRELSVFAPSVSVLSESAL